MARVYLIGSLRNPKISEVGNVIRSWGFEVFDDWHAVGPEADDHWREYETLRGRSYAEALKGWAARNTFEFDKRHLDTSDAAVLVAPAGKSGHLELGYVLGSRKKGFVLFAEQPDRWDVMYQFATGVCFSLNDLRVAMSVALRTTRRKPEKATSKVEFSWCALCMSARGCVVRQRCSKGITAERKTETKPRLNRDQAHN